MRRLNGAREVPCFWVYPNKDVEEYNADICDAECNVVCVVSIEALDKRFYVMKDGTVHEGGSIVV